MSVTPKKVGTLSYYLKTSTHQNLAAYLKRKRTVTLKVDEAYGDTGLFVHGLRKDNTTLVLRDAASIDFYELPIATKPDDVKQVVSAVSVPTHSAVKSVDGAIALTILDDVKYDPRMFVPMRTGKAIDSVFSSESCAYPATNYMIVGDPGVGKSTTLLDYLSDVQVEESEGKMRDARVCFISTEMNVIDMRGYKERFPKFGKIPTLFMSEHSDKDPRAVIESVLSVGYDVVLIDSVTELAEDLATGGMQHKKAESWIIDLMVKHNHGQNKSNAYTTFLCIQQVTKGGKFVGGNKWKHNTTGMIEIRWEGEQRVILVEKNRRGFKFDRLPFNLDTKGVTYREDLVLINEEAAAMSDQANADLAEQQRKFRERFIKGSTASSGSDLLDTGDGDDDEDEE